LCRHRGGEKFENSLFTGNGVDRFGRLLHSNILKEPDLIPEDVDLGAVRKDLGTHSNRKGASTFLCGLGSSITYCCIFEGSWSLGVVQDKYILTGAAGDQIVGQAAAGLPVYDSRFATLPPHFTLKGLVILRKIGSDRILESFGEMPKSIQLAFPNLLASVIYHCDFLQEKLSPDHPLWMQPLFTREVVVDDVIFEDEEVGMAASGIPSHILIKSKLDEVNQLVQDLSSKYERESVANRELIEKQLLLPPMKLNEELMKHFQIQGVNPINMADLQRAISENSKAMMDKIEELIAAQRGSSSSGASENCDAENNDG